MENNGICIRFTLQALDNQKTTTNILHCLSQPHLHTFDSGIESLSLDGGLYSTQAQFIFMLMQLYEK